MTYFLIAWESHNDNLNIASDETIYDRLKNCVGKESLKNASTDIEKEIRKTGKDLELLTGKISNIVFLKTNNAALTENIIAQWITYEAGETLFTYRDEVFVKQVSDPYPLLKSIR